MGKDFFLIDSKLPENYTKAIHEGPWFIGGHFLAVRQWEPAFKPSLATFNFMALCIRLPELTFEFYDQQILLHKIGNTISHLLRMDICTKDTTRGQYARLCIQVPIDHPLITCIFIGNHKQRILYEGINLLYYHCGRIGHLNTNCTYTSLTPPIHIPIESKHSSSSPLNMQSQNTPATSSHTTEIHLTHSTTTEANRIVQTAVANHQLNQSNHSSSVTTN